MLVTARLALRSFQADDADALFAMFSDPDVVRYWSTPAWTNRAQADAAIQDAAEEDAYGEALCLAVVLRETAQLVGYIKLYGLYHENRRCCIGYALARVHWGRGYMAEGLAAALRHAFTVMNINRVEADVDARNAGSARTLARLGFRKEGTLRERWIVQNIPRDSVLYALLRSDWTAPCEER